MKEGSEGTKVETGRRPCSGPDKRCWRPGLGRGQRKWWQRDTYKSIQWAKSTRFDGKQIWGEGGLKGNR